jgi:hypothetical protein
MWPIQRILVEAAAALAIKVKSSSTQQNSKNIPKAV